jgi:hypothetical protein
MKLSKYRIVNLFYKMFYVFIVVNLFHKEAIAVTQSSTCRHDIVYQWQ